MHITTVWSIPILIFIVWYAEPTPSEFLLSVAVVAAALAFIWLLTKIPEWVYYNLFHLACLGSIYLLVVNVAPMFR